MRKIFMTFTIMFVLQLPMIGFGQTPITLTFIGKDSVTLDLISLDSVYVKNLTESCDTMLYGSVPVFSFIAIWPVGIDENNINTSESFILNQNYPNPFQGSTFVNIYREYGGPLNFMLFDLLGATLAEYQDEFEKGFHSFSISTSEAKVMILVVFDERSKQSIKIVSNGEGFENNSIQYLGHNPNVEKIRLKSMDNSGFIFFLGDQMKYTAHANGYSEKTILDSPIGDSIYYFPMSMFYLPTVTTSPVTDITQTSATCGGNVTSDGGDPVSVRGVCWSTSPNPTTSDFYTTDGSGTGAFISYLTGLTPNTSYFVRSYATNNVGTGYGNEIMFTTGQTQTTPIVTTADVTNITETTATSGGNVTSDGGSPVTARGVCWDTSPNPTTAGSHTIDGAGMGTFVSNLTGLTGGTLYYVRAYATNSIGTSYGNELTFTTLTLPTVTTTTVTNIAQTTATSGGTVSSDGGSPVTARGVCWSTSPNPTTSDSHTTDGTGTGTFVSNLTGLTGGTLYYVRAYATNSVGTAYGNELTFTTLTFPTVSTATVTNITQTTATSGGNVTSDGGSPVTARGVCWDTSPNPTTAGSHTIDGAGMGTFVSNLTGLTGGTLYYVRAYATNSIGTAYGNELTFTTSGTNWIVQTSGTTQNLLSVHFPDANTGYVVGVNGIILKTTNGGTTWVLQTSSCSDSLTSVYFTDTNTGYIVGQWGTILKTTNGGTDWTTLTSGTSICLYSVYFTEANTGYVVGGSGTILKTTNGGTNWTPQTSGTTDGLLSVYFPDANTGYVAGYYGIILKTTNSGTDWTTQTSGTSNHFWSVHFTDANTGYVVSYSGTIHKTTNGGTTWVSQVSGFPDWLTSVYFTNVNTGYVVGVDGTILKTTNGGATWLTQTSGTSNQLNSVYFPDTNTGYIVGDYGTILKTSTGGK